MSAILGLISFEKKIKIEENLNSAIKKIKARPGKLSINLDESSFHINSSIHFKDYENNNILNSQKIFYTFNEPKTLEQLHYRMIFESYYPLQSHLIPHFWMPNYTNATDASARTLNIYKKYNKKEEICEEV